MTARHGTARDYDAGCRCDLCRDAWRKEMYRNWRSRTRRGLDVDDSRHGTANGYGNWGCRCEACRSAWAARQAEYRAKRVDQ